LNGNVTGAMAAQLETIMITSDLQRRTSRTVNVQRENNAFHELADCLATKPDVVLDKIVDLALRLCDADTVGISLEEVDEAGEAIFRWVAMAGELKQLVGGTTPRNFSPCGVCVDQRQPILMDRLDRVFPYFKTAPLPFVEALLLPWGVTGGPVGTLWVVAHSDRRKFELEDVRIMGSLAAFASGAIRLRQVVMEKERIAAASRIISEVAHHINNPLQGAIFALFKLNEDRDLSASAREMVSVLQLQLGRVVALSAELLKS